MVSRTSVSLLFFTLLSFSPQVFAKEGPPLLEFALRVSTPFSTALSNLQNQIEYTFKNVGLLRRAMTHASFSEENNKALSILGESVIEATVALKLLVKDVDISSKDLNSVVAQVSKVDGSCNADGTRLGLQNIVRVSARTNATAPSVVCGAFRAIFGAIALDAGSSDEAGRIHEKVHVKMGSMVTM